MLDKINIPDYELQRLNKLGEELYYLTEHDTYRKKAIYNEIWTIVYCNSNVTIQIDGKISSVETKNVCTSDIINTYMETRLSQYKLYDENGKKNSLVAHIRFCSPRIAATLYIKEQGLKLKSKEERKQGETKYVNKLNVVSLSRGENENDSGMYSDKNLEYAIPDMTLNPEVRMIYSEEERSNKYVYVLSAMVLNLYATGMRTIGSQQIPSTEKGMFTACKVSPSKYKWWKLFFTEDMTNILKEVTLTTRYEKEVFQALNTKYLDFFMSKNCRTFGEIEETHLKLECEVIPGSTVERELKVPIKSQVSFEFLAQPSEDNNKPAKSVRSEHRTQYKKYISNGLQSIDE
ncbi:MAG: hypothetical protein R3Y24_05345 [Eubacteriales bacterium]